MHGTLASSPERAINKSAQSCKFGTIVLALVALEQNRPIPVKPAMWLADKLGCSERGAQYLIDGQRGVSAKAIAFIVNELTD